MPFQPRYITEDELPKFKLPSPSDYSDIMRAVDEASTLIDETCGRVDSGFGSLVYSTYTEQKKLKQSRMMLKVSFKPMASLSASLREELSASGSGDNEADDNLFTGFTANTIFKGTELSPILSLKIRTSPGTNNGGYLSGGLLSINDQLAMTVLGSSGDWTELDLTLVDFNKATGDVWLPGSALGNEVLITYNSGYDPRSMPRGIKFATAATIKNSMLRGGATGVKGISGAAKMSMNFTEELIDQNIENWLRNYKTVVAR